jgi:hypothetical protein
MVRSDIEAIAASFAHRHKAAEQYERYFCESQQGDRLTLVAVIGEQVAGYTK